MKILKTASAGMIEIERLWCRGLGVLFLGVGLSVFGQQGPDLTTANLALIDTSRNYNLGPTGLRGWIYSSGALPPQWEMMTSFAPYQVLVTTVGPNTPAAGIIQINDVLLGVNTGLNNLPVPLFTNDTRKAIGVAIGAAEAGDGWMNFKVWRAGVTSDVSIQLPLRGLAYSATAPYNCPKSALILSNAFNILANRSFNLGTPGNQVLGLALLASGNTNFFARVQTYARSLTTVPDTYEMWDWSYKSIFLSEYYLKTGDTNILPVLGNMLVDMANSTDRYGTIGHNRAVLNADGGYTSQGYGPVNQVGLSVDIGLVMGRKAMLAAGLTVDPAIDAAIARGNGFFGWYVQKGNVPYGEHVPWMYHAGNGKEALAALLFTLQGNKPVEAEYWTRLTLAGYAGREYGHSGQGFSYLWGGPAANLGGTNAMAAYMQQIEWHLDLERRCDGSFVYDGAEQYGGSIVSDYWAVGGNNAYNALDPTASYVLTYATPLQQLYITGKNSTNALSSAVVTNAIWAGAFDRQLSTYGTNTLMAALSEYDPLVRTWAATALGTNASAAPLFSTLTNLAASSTNAWLRASVCTALGAMKNTGALPVLGQRLTDPDIGVRYYAALAFQNFGINASSQVTNMLAAFVTNATNPKVIDWSDPVQIANGQLAVALFGDSLGSAGSAAAATVTNSRSLLYPALRAALVSSPDSVPRLDAAAFIHSRLALADVQALAPEIIQCAQSESLADRMWSGNGRAQAIATLAQYNCAETVPVALSTLNVEPGMEWGSSAYLDPAQNALPAFGDSARWTLPTLKSYLPVWGAGSSTYNAATNAIISITAATSTPASVTNLYPVAFSQVVNTTNASAITLRGSSCRTNSLSYLNVTPPAHGVLTGTAPNLTYTPNAGYVGLDSFTFQAADSMTNSGPATVSLIVGTPAGAGLQGQYYDNMDFTNLKFTRLDPQINFDWGLGSPSNTMAADTFSVRWTGVLLAPESGNYTFSSLNSDGVRLYVNGTLMIDDWVDQTRQWTDGASIYLTAGQQYALRLDYYENTGDAAVKLKWTGPSFAGTNGVLITNQWLFDGTGATTLPVLAYPQSVTMLQNTNVAITLGGSVNATSFAIVSGPAHGSLSGPPPAVTYTPAANYNGTDSFTFSASDGVSNSAPATVSISIWAGQPTTLNWTNTLGGVWSTTGNWSNNVAPVATGQPYYLLNFKPTGTYSVTNDLNSGFAVNELDFSGTVTLGGNSLSLVANGPLLPQVNQNSAGAVTITPSVNLGATTTIGGVGSGGLTLGGVISGSGEVILNNYGVVSFNSLNNSYSGGTVINTATVSQGTPGGGNTVFLGTGPITINPAGTLNVNRSGLTNRIVWNGGTVTGGNGFGDSISGPITLTGIGTVNFGYTGHLDITGNVSGTGGLTKVGAGPLRFFGTNSYTGPTTISVGSNVFFSAASVAPGPLSISSGAVAFLNYTGTRTIAGLTLGGTSMPGGIYGSPTSPATIKDAHFTGSGTVTVIPPPTASFTAAPISGYAPLRVVFSDTSSGSITNRQWAFGDGNSFNTTTQTTVTNLYVNPGLYSVTLTASGNGGAATNTQTSFISVASVPPPVFSGTGALTMNPGGAVTVAINSLTGVKYRLLLKNDLQSTNAWTIVTPPLPNGWTNGNGAALQLTDPTSAGVGQRFYQVEAQSVSAP